MNVLTGVDFWHSETDGFFMYHYSKLSSGLFRSIDCATAKFLIEGGHFGKNHQDLISLQLQFMSLAGGYYHTNKSRK